MAKVIVTVATTSTQFPAGTVPAGISVSIPGQPSQNITAAPYSAPFDNVPPGTYTATAQAIDASGNPLGSPVTSASFDVPAPPVSVDVPVSISISM